jgi:alpha-L-rhamnosidase
MFPVKPVRSQLMATRWAAEANVHPRQPADAAAWIWHPACGDGCTVFLRFVLELVLAGPACCRVHVTADQRYQFSVNGTEVGFGPDRGHVGAWAVATHELELPAGSHRLEALVWWLRDESLALPHTGFATNEAKQRLRPPVAQASWRGGFLCAGEGGLADLINTGRAPWRVEDLTAAVALHMPDFPVYVDVGPEFRVDGRRWRRPRPAVMAAPVAGAIIGNPHGVQRTGWRLAPATLPEQHRTEVKRGRLRQIRAGDGGAIGPDEQQAWEGLFHRAAEVTVPAGQERTLLWDFEDYVCGYARLTTRGGVGATVRIEWAEALFDGTSVGTPAGLVLKGRRDEINGKYFNGIGDEYHPAAGRIVFPAFWWRAGRYLRICVRTAGRPLTLQSLGIVATGYPLGPMADARTDDVELDEVLTRCERTMRACAHEVWTDCPYYEQMAYVGDSRISALGNYALFADDRLSRRMLVLFDETRRENGLVAERAPASWTQVSVTYSLLWVLMVRDFGWWRDDRAFVCERLRGVRAMLDEVLALADPSGLLREVPGWSFVDWVPAWHEGCGPGVREGDSCLVNLHLLLALRAHAELEQAFGEPELAVLAQRRAARLGRHILNRYWDAERGLLADTGALTDFSEHAQALGLLAGLAPARGVACWINAWLAGELTAPSLYFTHYVLDAFHRADRTDALHARLGAWREVSATGLLTMPETPEPTRSDCHGWSAHVRWHFAASVAGVRPAAPGFSRVEVAPQPGALGLVEADVFHPRGQVRVVLERNDGGLRGTVELPRETPGTLRWRDARLSLSPGCNPIDLPVRPAPG